MLDYPAVRAIAAVIQTGSFERAANVLNVTPSAVSQRVKQLEERLGATLVVRGTPCTATEAGDWLCRHFEHVGMLENELFRNLPGLAAPNLTGAPVTVHIATNADSLGAWILPAIADFTRQSGYLVNLAVDDQDHTAAWLEGGRVLAAVTSMEKPVPGCRSVALGALRYHATASADFVATHFPDGVTASRIGTAPMLTFNQKDRLQTDWISRTLGHPLIGPTHWLPSTHSFVEACLMGMGWSMNPALLVGEHLQSGRLVELVPGSALDVPLFWQVNRLAAAQLVTLTNAVVATARRVLHPLDR